MAVKIALQTLNSFGLNIAQQDSEWKVCDPWYLKKKLNILEVELIERQIPMAFQLLSKQHVRFLKF